jgi:hypothetical protein
VDSRKGRRIIACVNTFHCGTLKHTPQVKILYDVTEAEITVLGKWKGKTKMETLPVDDNLAEVIQKAKELVKQW